MREASRSHVSSGAELQSSTITIGRLHGRLSRETLFLLAAIAVVVCLFASAAARAQDLEALDGAIATSTDPFMSQAPADALLLGGADATVGTYATDSGFPEAGVATVRPVNWISGPYLRGGVNFVLGDSLFDAEQETGYGISGGWRQPLGPEIGGDRFFFDLGGSYQESAGAASPVSIGGREILTLAGVVLSDTIVPNAFATSLEEVRRGSLHAAIGWFWGAGIDNASMDPQIRIATRFGGRVGHARGGFTDALIVAPPGPNETIDPVYYNKTDTYGGLFVGTEAILLQRQYSFGHFQWTVDGEFANDWINIGNVWEGSLGTASVMMGFMLSR